MQEETGLSDYLDKYNWIEKCMIHIFKIDNEERYGRKSVVDYTTEYLHDRGGTVVDIAAGNGTDLSNIMSNMNNDVVIFWGLEAYKPNIDILNSMGISTFQVDLEKERLPFEDGSVDIIIANQILEHCKELWWIMSEISRVLKVGGRVIIGVPNLASLHCRISLLFGKQPTCIETHGPHVRGFTYKDFLFFIEDGGYFKVIDRKGSGFYSLIPATRKFWAKVFPNLAVCMTLCVERTDMEGIFIDNLERTFYETNYYDGKVNVDFRV